MKENLWTVLVTSVILQCFGEVDGYRVDLVPSPTAEVEEGNALILHCSCDGSNNPYLINWYLNDDTFGLVIKVSSCKYLTTPEQYEIDRYSISCHETKVYLTIANISKDRDHHDTWKCDTTVIGMPPPQKASTTVVVIDAGKADTNSGPKIVVVAVALVVVGVIAVIFTVTVLVCRKRNDWVKNMKNKNHDQHQEQMDMLKSGCFKNNPHRDYNQHQEQTEMLEVNRISKEIDCNQA